jgi:hypothetical protein
MGFPLLSEDSAMLIDAEGGSRGGICRWLLKFAGLSNSQNVGGFSIETLNEALRKITALPFQAIFKFRA